MKNEKLVKSIAEETNIPDYAVEQTLEALCAYIIAETRKGNNVLIRNFGTFKGFDAKERKTNLVRGGTKITPARKLLKFYSHEDVDAQMNEQISND